MKKLAFAFVVSLSLMACGKKAANTTPQPDQKMEGAGTEPKKEEGTADPCAGKTDPCSGKTDPCAGGDPCAGPK